MPLADTPSHMVLGHTARMARYTWYHGLKAENQRVHTEGNGNKQQPQEAYRRLRFKIVQGKHMIAKKEGRRYATHGGLQDHQLLLDAPQSQPSLLAHSHKRRVYRG